jgi:hypothetical protein
LFHNSKFSNFRVSSKPGAVHTVGETAFVFEGSALKQVLFLRYDISNESNVPVSNLYLGFGADIDLWWWDLALGTVACGNLSWASNQTGYNLAKNYSYTYVKPDSSDDGALRSGCYGALIGYSILDMYSEGGLSQPKLAHRILTRSHEEPIFDFAEAEINNAEQVKYALQGLSATGGAMVDPVTGENTAFAYTGDPFSGTGWLDSRKDVRSLQSIMPFDLMPGETRVMTVAVFTTLSDSFKEGFFELEATFDEVLRQREKWDY